MQAIRKSASIRVRPVTMTALAAFFAMVPAPSRLERGSEANAPLARAILGGLLAGEPSTLFVLPCLYSLLVRDRIRRTDLVSDQDPRREESSYEEQDHTSLALPFGGADRVLSLRGSTGPDRRGDVILGARIGPDASTCLS